MRLSLALQGFILVLLLVAIFLASGVRAEERHGFDHNHAKLDQLLQKYVLMQGLKSSVNYRALSADKDELNSYLKQVQALSLKEFESFNEAQQLSFLINAYNAFTLKLIVDNYPVKSIKDLGGFLSSPWKKEFFTLFGKEQHLDYIEHGLIRKRFSEPRIHFALVCASRGCPALQRDAYTADKLEEQLEIVTRNFMNDTDRNHFDADENTLYLSPIFKWFTSDFEKEDASVIEFVGRYVSDTLSSDSGIKPRIRYLDYDWSLNDSLEKQD